MPSNIRRTFFGTTIVSALGLLAACATDPSQQLVDARQTYAQAHESPANQLVPDRVYDARVALDAAEREHERKAGTDTEKHLAYIAHRRSLEAMTAADLAKAEKELQQSQREREDVLISQRDQIRDQLDERQQDIEGERVATADQLERMEQRRQEEMREFEETHREEMQQLRDAVGGVATVQQGDGEEMSITLDGVVLFESGESDLLPIAENRLETVAQALQEHAGDKTIRIEGHTDSTGPAELNQRLSKQRADAVKEFLVAQGLEEGRIETAGKGQNRPLVPNDSPTNRAMNRRVEIIVDNGGGAGGEDR